MFVSLSMIDERFKKIQCSDWKANWKNEWMKSNEKPIQSPKKNQPIQESWKSKKLNILTKTFESLIDQNLSSKIQVQDPNPKKKPT